nr:hypothetical protein GCM10020092_019790 [Actinoplanes digitatis]
MHVIGGDHSVDIEYVALGLMTRVEVESGDSEYNTDQEFHRQRLTGSFKLDAGARHDVPFRFDVPWETPHHRGVRAAPARHDDGPAYRARGGPGGRQERPGRGGRSPAARHRSGSWTLSCAWASGSAAPMWSGAGCTACSRRCRSTRRSSSIRSAQYASGINQLEVTFIPTPHNLQVVLEIDKRGGLFTEGHDAFGRFDVDYHTVDQTDWTAQLNGWLQQSAQRRGFF